MLYNSLGEVVLSENVIGSSSVINKDNLMSGIYILHIIANGVNEKVKIQVMK